VFAAVEVSSGRDAPEQVGWDIKVLQLVTSALPTEAM
jgi:hypothetical protein